GWHWWIPTRLRVSASDVVYHVDNLANLVTEMAATMPKPDASDPDAPPSPSPEETAAGVKQVMDLLTKYGLNKPSMDYTLGWNWDPATGAAAIDTAFGVDAYMHMDLKYEGGLPSFKAVSDLVPDDPEKADQAAIGKVFEAASTLKLVEFNIADE